MTKKKLSPLGAKLLKIALVLLISIGTSKIVINDPILNKAVQNFIENLGSIIVNSISQQSDSSSLQNTVKFDTVLKSDIKF